MSVSSTDGTGAPAGVSLHWQGKSLPEPSAKPPLLTPVRRFGAPGAEPNLLIEGDNRLAMEALLPTCAGRFALIYLDPPFFTGKQQTDRRVGPRPDGSADGSPETAAPLTYSDDWNHDLSAYLQWLYERLALCRTLLADTGSLYLHLSWHSVHYAKLILDELFGVERFQNEIVWCYREAINSRKRWNRKHDTLLFYTRGEEFLFNADAVLEPYSETTLKKFRHRDEKGPYRLMGRGITDSPLRSKRDLPPEMETLFPELTYRHYLGEGTLPVDYWLIDIENQASKARTGYPTQKPEALLERILSASSGPGDLVGDFCAGSGTTLAAAHRLGRRWIGCDSNPAAVEVASRRLEALGSAFAVERCETAAM